MNESTCFWILGILGGTVATLAGYIAKRHTREVAAYKERLEKLETHVKITDLLKGKNS